MGNEPPFRSALATQFRVIGALLMREIITRYGRDNIGFLWIFFEPMMFTLGVTALWSAVGHYSRVPIVPFAITGYSTVWLWRNCANRCARAIQPNLALLYHRQVTILDLFLARLLLEIAGATMSFVVLLSLFVFLGLADPPSDPLIMAAGWLLMAWFGASLGLTVGALSERAEAFDRFWHTFTYLVFPLSGAVFMVDWLPPSAQGWALLLPMVNGTEMIRDGYFGHLVHTHYSASYLAIFDFAMLLVGLRLVERGRHLVIVE
jgi:capsular polysaccharide transport system permease protein